MAIRMNDKNTKHNNTIFTAHTDLENVIKQFKVYVW